MGGFWDFENGDEEEEGQLVTELAMLLHRLVRVTSMNGLYVTRLWLGGGVLLLPLFHWVSASDACASFL